MSQFRTVGVVEDPPGTPLQPLQEIGTLVTSNAGEASIKGLEIEWDWIPWADGRLTGGIGILDATFDAWPGYAGEAYFCDERAAAGPEFACVPQDDGSGNVDIAGNELPYSTPMTLTIAYQHEFLLNDGASIAPYAKFHWKDDTHFTEGNFDAIDALSDKRDAFGTLDLSVKYTSPSEAFFVEAFVYNATNERWKTYFVDSNQPGAPLFTWNPPRSFGVRAAYNFQY